MVLAASLGPWWTTLSIAPVSERNESFLNGAARILGDVREHGTIKNAQCRPLLGVSIHRAWYLLRKLSRNGRRVQDGSKRGARYHLPPV